MGDRGHDHNIRDQSDDRGLHRIFKLGIILNFSFFIADMIVWWLFTDTGSAAIFGDSLHNGLHGLAHAIALWGHAGECEPSFRHGNESIASKLRKNYAAQGIGWTIIAGAILIAGFGAHQIINPEKFSSAWMIIMSSLDIISDAVLLILLWSYRYDPAARAMITDIKIDALASVAVIVGALIILFTGFYRADGIVALPIAFIALWLAKETISEAKHSAKNLVRDNSDHKHQNFD